MFFGLDFVATVPHTVSLAAQNFGPAKAPIVFGWAFAAHQFGTATSALAAGLSRDVLATYVPAFVVADLTVLSRLAPFAAHRVV